MANKKEREARLDRVFNGLDRIVRGAQAHADAHSTKKKSHHQVADLEQALYAMWLELDDESRLRVLDRPEIQEIVEWDKDEEEPK